MLIPKGGLRTSSLLAEIGALVACAAWALGTLYYRSIDTSLSSLMFMALQMCMGGLMLLTVAVGHGDAARWTFNVPGMVALAYLTLASSCLAYTAYGWLSLHAAPAVTGTYGYVNPAIAAYLGWQFLDEHLSKMQIMGMVTIILAVGILTLPGGTLTDRKTLEEPKVQ
jgi:drug/metabolite transporter (DMT)-like permease